jgi:Tfp pilus assembly protein FimV
VRRLLDRVVGPRRNAKTETRSDAGDVDRERQVVALEQRVEQLEALVEGLQDSIHREAIRQDKAIEALDARTQAPELARALGKYSREHGL